jgi:hypothetical protein
MCNVPRRAWWRLTNTTALMYAQAVGVQDELYYADRSTNRVVALSGIFTASSSNKNDANGTAVTPLLEYRALTRGTGLTSWGDGRLSFYMADAASDNPTMGITVKTGVRAATSSTPSESPLAENTDEDRKRFTVAKDAQAVTIKLQQSNASSATEVYALEVEGRPHSPVEDGVA